MKLHPTHGWRQPLFGASIFFWSVFALVAGIAIAPDCLAQDTQAISYLRAGTEAMHAGNTADAEKNFRAAIASSPQLPEAHLDLGLALLRDNRPEEAVSSLSKAIELNAATPGAHLFLGIAEYQRNNFDVALAALKQEISANPKNVEALTWLGIVELAAGHPEAATAPLDEAARISPGNMDVLDYRARAHSLVADASYRRMREIDPDSWHVHRALGQSFAETGNPEAAVKEYQAAIVKQPRNADLYEALGAEFQKLSKFDLAIKAYGDELKLSPNNPIALYNLGTLDVEHGDPAAGVSMLEKAVPLLQHPAPGFFYLGLGMVKLGRDQEAAVWLEKSVEAEPSDFIKRGAYFQLARAYRRLHRPGDATRALAELQKIQSEQAATQKDKK